MSRGKAARRAEHAARKRRRKPDSAGTPVVSSEAQADLLEALMLRDYPAMEESARRLLAQDPSDAANARYFLIASLFEQNCDAALESELEEYQEQSAEWHFAEALFEYRRSGDTEAAREFLLAAQHLDPGFLDYLLYDKVLNERWTVDFRGSPEMVAHSYARLFLPAWRAVPGAVTWARRVLKAPALKRRPDDADVPLRSPLDDLLALPVQDDTWHVVVRRYESADASDAYWGVGVLSLGAQQLRQFAMLESAPTANSVWNSMLAAFLEPADGSPARPRTLVVEEPEWQDAWTPLLRDVQVDCRRGEIPAEAAHLLDGLAKLLEEYRRPTDSERDAVKTLRQTSAVWQADKVLAPTWVSNETQGTYRPWCVLVVDRKRSFIVGVRMVGRDESFDAFWDGLLQIMQKPMMNGPRRPRTIEVRDPEYFEFLQPRLKSLGIECVRCDELPQLDSNAANLARGDKSGKCAVADGVGVDRRLLEEYYESAAEFFRRAPWRLVPGEMPIRVRCRGLSTEFGERFAIVLGCSGMQMGLVLIDDWPTTYDMLNGFLADDSLKAMTVSYDEPLIMAGVDLLLVERYGWPIATPEAYPAALRVWPRRAPQSPTADELRLLIALLRSLPDFLEADASLKAFAIECGGVSFKLCLDLPK